MNYINSALTWRCHPNINWALDTSSKPTCCGIDYVRQKGCSWIIWASQRFKISQKLQREG